jgi:hypothetical protein
VFFIFAHSIIRFIKFLRIDRHQQPKVRAPNTPKTTKIRRRKMLKNTATELYLDYEIIIIKLTVVEVARGGGLGTTTKFNGKQGNVRKRSPALKGIHTNFDGRRSR